MPTARELLQQADALMQRNRARQIDTEIPELTEAVAMTASAPFAAASPPPMVLDDIPELTDSVEEIEIASIVELPEDDVEPSAWPHSVRASADGHDARAEVATPPPGLHAIEPIGGRVLPLFAIAAKPFGNASAIPVTPPTMAPQPAPAHAASAELAVAKATVVELPLVDAIPADETALAAAEGSEASVAPATAASSDDNAAAMAEAVDPPVQAASLSSDAAVAEGGELPVGDALPVADKATADVIDLPRTAPPVDDAAMAEGGDLPPAAPAVELDSPARAKAPAADDWARWEALAEEIRMQVLQRIDIFTDTGLREQLSVQMQPIVERASAELVATINAQVGKLLRAYIADAIEREIEKWRTGNS